MSSLFAYNLAVLFFSSALFSVCLINLFALARPKALVATGGDESLPRISVLVPARNEEDNIEPCVRSLLSLNYPNFEVLVLDDSSTDSTYEILCRLRDQDHRLRILVGAALPDGWCGKPYGCWQLAHAAEGEYLLFTDADCVFAPDSLLFSLGALQEHDADLVSLAPSLESRGFWEQLVLPVLYVIVMAFMPLWLIRHTNSPIFSGANGAFLFLRKETYLAVDGHQAVKSQLAEDIKFAQHWKRCGRTMWYGDGQRVYSVRMYHGLSEIWSGFTKNIFPAFSKNILVFVPVLLFLLCVLVLPAVLTVLGTASHARWTCLAALSLLLELVIHLAVALKFRTCNPLMAPLAPLAWVVTIALAVNSARASYSRTGPVWKGRIYY